MSERSERCSTPFGITEVNDVSYNAGQAAVNGATGAKSLTRVRVMISRAITAPRRGSHPQRSPRPSTCRRALRAADPATWPAQSKRRHRRKGSGPESGSGVAPRPSSGLTIHADGQRREKPRPIHGIGLRRTLTAFAHEEGVGHLHRPNGGHHHFDVAHVGQLVWASGSVEGGLPTSSWSCPGVPTPSVPAHEDVGRPPETALHPFPDLSQKVLLFGTVSAGQQVHED
jgi:hypothetical protein